MSGRGLRWDRPKNAGGEAMPFRKAPSDRATRPNVERVADLAGQLGRTAPAPANGKYLTKREAGRFIDECLIELARRRRG